ncbi:MAG: hypothetical protein ABI036_17400 [Fibrobacteria bacterium]
MTAELTRASRTSADADLPEMARNLNALAYLAIDYPGAIKRLSVGFLQMAALAGTCGQPRIFMTSRALANMLNRLDRAPESDAAFILGTVIAFLDSFPKAQAEQIPF